MEPPLPSEAERLEAYYVLLGRMLAALRHRMRETGAVPEDLAIGAGMPLGRVRAVMAGECEFTLREWSALAGAMGSHAPSSGPDPE